MTLTPTEAGTQLSRVFDAFPSYREYLGSTSHAGRTEDAWCKMLADCDLHDVVVIVGRIVAGKLPGHGVDHHGKFEKPDQLPVNIRREANQIRSERTSKKEQFENYHNQAKGAWDTIAQNGIGRIGCTLGAMVLAGKITREENDRRMDELLAWDKGGETPSWLPEVIQGNAKRSPFLSAKEKHREGLGRKDFERKIELMRQAVTAEQ